jgi:hypothetical protein
VSRILPVLVLEQFQADQLRAAVLRYDVRRGGQFAVTPSSIQWWDRPWPGPDGPGQARLLGALDIAVDHPMRGQSSIDRAVVTHAGLAAGLNPADVARTVLDLADLVIDPERLTRPAPPPADPFRTGHPGLYGD